MLHVPTVYIQINGRNSWKILGFVEANYCINWIHDSPYELVLLALLLSVENFLQHSEISFQCFVTFVIRTNISIVPSHLSNVTGEIVMNTFT